MIGKVLRYQATHNPHTRLPNLDLLIEKIDQSLRLDKAGSLIVLVINGVNEIGEHHGIAAALHALNVISGRIRERVNASGFAAHIHGELFAAIIQDADPQVLAERLWSELTCPIPWQTAELHLVVGIGVVSGVDHPEMTETLVRAGFAAARDALAQNACGGVSVYTAQLGQQLERQYQVVTRLRPAPTNGSLSLALQAKVGTVDGRLLGAEALIRWKDSQLGIVPPSEFIPLAERNGMILDISAWVLRKALAVAADWQRAGLDLGIAVNLSAKDLHRPNLIGHIRNALTESGCDPTRLTIELTESSVAEYLDLAIQKLHSLKDLGIALALDDFGTGYSSLSYLRRFPIDTLKIDRSFVADTPNNSDAVAIVSSIAVLAQKLGMQTVAEGVETADQATFLRELGVDALQGYLFSHPVTSDAFMALAMNGYAGFKKHLTKLHY